MAMKVVFALLALIAFTQAKHFYWYAGSTTTNATGLTGSASPTANYVASFTGGTCTAGATATGYQKFTINATTGSFWYITALVEHSSLYGAQLQIYNGAFNPTAPCTGLIALHNSYSSEAPHFSDLLWLATGLYDVVITADDVQYNGLFAVHADSSFGQHVTTDSDNWSEIPYQSTSSCTSYGSAPYTYFTVAAPYTGYFDIFFYAYNATQTGVSATATLYNGTVTFLGTGNATVPADPCAGQPWAQTIYGYSTYTDISKTGYDAGVFMAMHLNGGQNYTLHVTSYYSDEINNYGFWWRPSVVFQMGNTANYYPPSLSGGFFDSAVDTCDPVTSPFLWNSHTFASLYSTVVVDTGASPGYGFDERTCIYVGNNSGTPYTVAPNNCTGVLQCGDSGSGDPVAGAGLTGNTVTVVEMPYYSGTGDEGDNYALWVYSGVQLGPSPAPLSSTTGESSTSSAATQIAAVVLIVAAMLF